MIDNLRSKSELQKKLGRGFVFKESPLDDGRIFLNRKPFILRGIFGAAARPFGYYDLTESTLVVYESEDFDRGIRMARSIGAKAKYNVITVS